MQNRIYKFRAWNKEKKKMWWNVQNAYDTLSHHCCSGEEERKECRMGDLCFKPCSFGDVLDDENYVVMQSTGLKDKNGIMIFEGDVVSDGEDVGVISYMNETTEYIIDYWKKGDKKSRGASLSSFGEVEIIGNVWEQPEHLK